MRLYDRVETWRIAIRHEKKKITLHHQPLQTSLLPHLPQLNRAGEDIQQTSDQMSVVHSEALERPAVIPSADRG